MELQEKIGQLFFIGLPGTHYEGDTQFLVEDIRPGGVCLFARNCKDASDIRSLLDKVRENSHIRTISKSRSRRRFSRSTS